MKFFKHPIIFEWDKGNASKNVVKHKVSNQEAEEVFFDKYKKILKDILHSGSEERYVVLGKTKHGRLLVVAFTTRRRNVRVISARPINKKETHLYEKST